ncbi:fumarylacetoacetate hydrolase family protein [Streptomyces sp. 110]|uniref:Fumarylacetoacetate hydrolase family protein n=1 Tax=Streptomyces endocoffeicus TaxID=2898945 RepID=A0ABS1PKZ6_9ACTN|nr:fumarylacetoacetate hydrolase family protein [Streptomyces endocoffeicus]MBL1112451.1 fumarylacetoacetate hydrolase family protein [Streptomyces endocoffeicus]
MTRHESSPTPTTWSLATAHTADRGSFCAALGEDGIREVPALRGYPGAFEALQDWAALAPGLRAYDPREAVPVRGARLLAPVRYPRTVLCSGANYRDHLAEMTGDGATRVRPFFFLKPPTTTVIGPDDPIVIPADESQKVDWEAELAVVIGRAGRDIPMDRAAAHIAGYTIVDDISARGPHHRADAFAEPFAWDWLASKGQDTFCPTGPGVTPVWLVPDPHDLPIRLTVNGHEEQVSNTREMIQSVPELIAAASALITLQPGDILATGTPAGVGLPRDRFLHPGDTVEITIGHLGRLRNPVTARETPHGTAHGTLHGTAHGTARDTARGASR